MALLHNQQFICKLWKRIPNDSNDKVETPIVFRAQIISEKERTFNQRIANFFTTQTRLALRTDSRQIYEESKGEVVRGYVEFQGEFYQIQAINYDLTDQSQLGGGRFAKGHTERNAIKIITLV